LAPAGGQTTEKPVSLVDLLYFEDLAGDGNF
jgi:hypothetical protein